MRYIINTEIGLLADAILRGGFTGEAKFSNNGCTGTVEIFGDDFIALELTGFCKETLFIAYDTEEKDYILVGRYDIRNRFIEVPTVDDIVKLAWSTYKDYKSSKEWGRPTEWDSLWKKAGYITTKTIQKTVEVEKD